MPLCHLKLGQWFKVRNVQRNSAYIQSLDSILAQTYQNFEVIVVNDDTRHVLKPYQDRLRVMEKPNGGKSSAVNLGLEHAQGDYIWVFDDDLAYPDKI